MNHVKSHDLKSRQASRGWAAKHGLEARWPGLPIFLLRSSPRLWAMIGE